MSKMIDGYEVAYTHRGSWKASMHLDGHHLADIPIAWDRDLSGREAGKQTLLVWFERPVEAARILETKEQFVAALSKWADGKGRTENIKGLFLVVPSSATDDPTCLLCNVLGRVRASDGWPLAASPTPRS